MPTYTSLITALNYFKKEQAKSYFENNSLTPKR
jgi:hypothetical protein